jgi:hypothetical protein
LAGDGLEPAANYLARFREFWEGSLDRLDEHIRRIQHGAETTKAHTNERDRR